MNVGVRTVLPPVEKPLVIGLVNNMAPSAMALTRQQFSTALSATGRAVSLLGFTIRGDCYDGSGYLPIDALKDYAVDGIIVTGMEASADDLRDEWLWSEITKLYDFCEMKAMPAIWSCLAAHAAVLHRDGIKRQRQNAKLSGVFTCQSSIDHHRLTASMPSRWRCPHSRYNGLETDLLDRRGYTVLSYGPEIGADIFSHKEYPGCFYFQGHPEYQENTLLLEFMRDMRRYLLGSLSICPEIPSDYLNYPSLRVVTKLRQQALAGVDIMPALRREAAIAKIQHSWLTAMTQLYINWLDIVADYAAHSIRWPSNFPIVRHGAPFL